MRREGVEGQMKSRGEGKGGFKGEGNYVKEKKKTCGEGVSEIRTASSLHFLLL